MKLVDLRKTVYIIGILAVTFDVVFSWWIICLKPELYSSEKNVFVRLFGAPAGFIIGWTFHIAILAFCYVMSTKLFWFFILTYWTSQSIYASINNFIFLQTQQNPPILLYYIIPSIIAAIVMIWKERKESRKHVFTVEVFKLSEDGLKFITFTKKLKLYEPLYYKTESIMDAVKTQYPSFYKKCLVDTRWGINVVWWCPLTFQ